MGFFDQLLSSFSWGGTGTSASVPVGTSIPTDGTDPRLSALFGLNAGGVNVTDESILTLSTVFACVDRIGKTASAFPWDVLRRLDGGGSEKAYDHPNYNLLHNQPHPLYGSVTFRRTIIAHYLLKGNFYAEILTNGRNRPVGLKIWQRHEVSVYKYNDRLYYQILPENRVLQDYQMIHLKNFSLDGLVGRSAIQVAMDTFRTGLQTQRFGNAFYENGARLSGILTHPSTLSVEAFERLKSDWKAKYSGTGNTGETAILEGGMDYKKLGIAPDEAQFLETRKFSRTEICAIFGVPPHLVMDLEHATFSNIENQNIFYVQHTLMPIIVAIEEEFNNKLFRASEQGTYYNKMNVKGLLRGDTAAQTAHISAMLDRAVYSANEARALDDLNPYDGGDAYLTQGANVPVDLLRDFYEWKIKSGDSSPAKPATA